MSKTVHPVIAAAVKAEHDRVMASWRAWYEQMPPELRAQIDEFNTKRRAADAAAAIEAVA